MMGSLLDTDAFGVWMAALLTIIVYSYLLGDNPLYRLAEHLFVGSAAAYAVVVAYHSVLKPKLFDRLAAGGSNLLYIIPLLLGLLLLAKGKVSWAWLGNTSVAFLFGVGAALAISGALFGTIQPQVQHTIVSLNPADYPRYGWEYVVDGLIVIVGTIGTLLYFHFSASKGRKSSEGRAGFVRFWAGIGRWIIMIAFGAIFANTVIARVALLTGRAQFLLYWAKGLMGGNVP